jgi:hypothetical protein
MAFVLKQSDTYSWPVAFDIPVDGGRHQRVTFDGVFKRVSQSRMREIGQMIQEDQLTEADLVSEILVGWSGITDDDGKDLPFSQKALAQLLDVPMLAAAIATTYLESHQGAKRKN